MTSGPRPADHKNYTYLNTEFSTGSGNLEEC